MIGPTTKVTSASSVLRQEDEREEDEQVHRFLEQVAHADRHGGLNGVGVRHDAADQLACRPLRRKTGGSGG